METTSKINTIKITVIHLPELKTARIPYITKMPTIKHNSCGTWKVIKELLAASPKRSLNHSISLLEADSENITNAEDNANTLTTIFKLSEKKLPKALKNVKYFFIYVFY